MIINNSLIIHLIKMFECRNEIKNIDNNTSTLIYNEKPIITLVD